MHSVGSPSCALSPARVVGTMDGVGGKAALAFSASVRLRVLKMSSITRRLSETACSSFDAAAGVVPVRERERPRRRVDRPKGPRSSGTRRACVARSGSLQKSRQCTEVHATAVTTKYVESRQRARNGESAHSLCIFISPWKRFLGYGVLRSLGLGDTVNLHAPNRLRAASK
jgi:hypothetical protein